jgi:predicted transcriptional regulator
MTINPTLRTKVIELYLQKRGRNEIARSLGISQGSVSNILRAYKSKSESTTISDTSLGQNCGQISNEHTTCAEDFSTESQTISNVESSKVTPQEFESFISNNNASISIGVNINNTGSPVLIDSRRLPPPVTTNTNKSANSNIVIRCI